MAKPASKKATYEDLYGIPENTTGQIIDGELIVTPRPSRRHGFSATALGGAVTGPYQFGQGGGSGGWIFIIAPEIGLGENILVPDLAGWKRERFPWQEEFNWISVAPNWVCEVLSPSTLRIDKVKKMHIYARHGIEHIWLIDPAAMFLEVFRLESGGWLLLGSYAENDKVRAEPFQEIEINLGDLWLENRQPSAS
ncbi:MAG: Uma2 family endonuclease [Deltaproteobacteria bacterium]|nr:Uma2 family endonuclease [Deltaproteobacteria bacterium]MBF0527045.1 Uma2 family endonuclease [Deltaproteobacteria bacterium]